VASRSRSPPPPHRLDDPRIQLGLPEVTLGLLPGGGGVVRTVRMLGVQKASWTCSSRAPRLKPSQALARAGLIHELAKTPTTCWRRRGFIGQPEGGTQPWDAKGYKMPGGTPSTRQLAGNLPAFPANLKKQLKGAHYPAPRAIMSAAVEGAQVDFDTAQRIESRYFTSSPPGSVAKNMIKAFFFDLQAINSGASVRRTSRSTLPKKVGVLGAGMMGAGHRLRPRPPCGHPLSS
jgi:3-hydroxyacyl-CoA dehydrogenase/enoyl-CoA hydratase/3-hydroxybutyryl-CoA epimerase